jgi:hypothetical protein
MGGTLMSPVFRRIMSNMIADNEGVFINDGRSSIRLTRNAQASELGYPTIIDVRAAPFQGAVLDNLLDYGNFRAQLVELHATLQGVAKLGSYEGNELEITGNGQGAIEARVRVIGEHAPLIELKFEIYIDQSYLPVIIEQIDKEFPAPYRAFPTPRRG